MRFTSFIAKNVLRRRARSLLTGLGVAVAITAVVALLGVSSGFQQSQAAMLATRGIDLVVRRAGLGTATGRLDESIGGRIRELPEVADVAPLLTDKVKLTDTPLPIPLFGYPPGSIGLTNLKIDPPGRPLGAKDKNGVLLGAILARNLGKKVGDSVEIEGTKFKVVGIYQGASMIENGGAMALLSDLQTLMERPGQVSEFQVVLKPGLAGDPTVLDRIRAEVKEIRDANGKPYGLEPLTTEEFVQNSNETKLSRGMAWMTSAIALVIGAVGMLNTMIMSVLERTQEIGILRAIGWRKGRVMGMILGESFILSAAGAIAGVLAAIALTRFLSRLPAAQGLVQAQISPSVIGVGILMALLVGLIGGAYPAFRGARLPPTEALRYE